MALHASPSCTTTRGGRMLAPGLAVVGSSGVSAACLQVSLYMILVPDVGVQDTCRVRISQEAFVERRSMLFILRHV